jgi:hypothetical protein
MTKNEDPLRQCFFPIPYVLSPDIPEKIRPVAQDGFEYWNKVVGWELFFNMGIAAFPREAVLESGLLLVTPIEGPGLNPFTSLQWDEKLGGCIDSVEVVVPVSWFDYNEQALKTMFRHEVGHALGLAHNPFEGTLMFPRIKLYVTSPAPARSETINEVRKLYPPPEKN